MLTNRKLTAAATALLAIATASGTGCTVSGGPFLGVAAFPIPVSPYFAKKKEDAHWAQERYDRVPILGPVTRGDAPVALDPPSDDEVMRAMEKVHSVQGGFPLLHETQRNNVRITKELIADYVDPVRIYPAVGPAQLHHAHYKCTIYYSETTWVGWPVPHRLTDEDSREVIYIDHNHLHMVADVDAGAGME